MSRQVLWTLARIILGLALIGIGGSLIILWGIHFDDMLDNHNRQISEVVATETVVLPDASTNGSNSKSNKESYAKTEIVKSPKIQLEKIRMHRDGLIVAYSFRLMCSFVLLFIGLLFIRPRKAIYYPLAKT